MEKEQGQQPEPTYYEKWYEKNKKRLSEKRKKRYGEDQEYRNRMLAASRSYRCRGKAPKPEAYSISLQEAADAIGVQAWAIREWTKRSYLPQPLTYSGRMWFTEQQVSLLKKIAEFFAEHGRRVTSKKRGLLENLVGLVYANWS